MCGAAQSFFECKSVEIADLAQNQQFGLGGNSLAGFFYFSVNYWLLIRDCPFKFVPSEWSIEILKYVFTFILYVVEQCKLFYFSYFFSNNKTVFKSIFCINQDHVIIQIILKGTQPITFRTGLEQFTCGE